MRAERLDSRWLVTLLLSGGLIAHALLLQQGWERVTQSTKGRDFASYYYAVEAAARGADPYDTRVLGALARADGTRSSVHPFLYPPPFIALMSWTRALPLIEAYRSWYWLDSLFLLAALLALYRCEVGRASAVAAALVLASFTPVVHSQVTGQANLLLLALVCVGLLQQRRGRSALAGVAIGAACMIKPLPALIVLWWIFARHWRAVLSAVGVALALSILALPWVGPADQLGYYLTVLPSIGSGEYGGLSVPVNTLSNHSLASVWAVMWPSSASALSRGASVAHSLSTLAVLAASFLALRSRRGDGAGGVAAMSALCVVALLLPVYSFEHHLVLTLPAWFAIANRTARGGLPLGAGIAAGIAYLVLAWPLESWLSLCDAASGAPGAFLRQTKTLALASLAVISIRVAATESGSSLRVADTESGSSLRAADRATGEPEKRA